MADSAELALLARAAVLVFGGGLVPRPYKVRIAVATTAVTSASGAKALARFGEIKKLFA